MKKGITRLTPKKPHQLFPRIHSWMHRHPQRTYAVIGLGVIIATLLIVAAIYAMNPQKVTEVTPIKITKKPTPAVVYYSPLTGMKVADEAATKMINDFFARQMELEYAALSGAPEDKEKKEQLQQEIPV